jgi:hypothetical protein
MQRHYPQTNGAPMAQFHLLHHWKIASYGDGAKGRAFTPRINGAAVAQRAPRAHPFANRSCAPALRLRRRWSRNAFAREQVACPSVRCRAQRNRGTFALEMSTGMHTIDHKPAKPPRIGKKIRQAIDLLLDGTCKNQTAVCERLKLSPSYLSRSLKSDKIQAFIARRTNETISAGKLAATATTIRLIQGAKSEHVQLQASEFIMGLNGYHANPSAPGITINAGGGAVGYVIKLRNRGAEVFEGNISEVGGVLVGRPMTDQERSTGVLQPQPRMIDVTPGEAEHPSAEHTRKAGEIER